MTRGSPPLALSVSLVYYDTDREVFARTLRGLGEAVARIQGEALVIIVDNSGVLNPPWLRAALAGMVGKAPCRLDLLQGHGNVGFACGHNLALSQAPASTYHLVCNPDVALPPAAVEAGIGTLQRTPGAVALAPWATDGAKRPLYLCKRYPDLLTLSLRAFAPSWLRWACRNRLDRYEMRDRVGAGDRLVRDVPLASGAFLLCRRDALRAIDGFDAGFFLYFEDFDLSLRLRAHGDILMDPAVRIVHLGGQAAGKGQWHRRVFIRSAWRFFSKHGWRLL